MIKCGKCRVEKLVREFPRTEHSKRCDHPQTCCLRCAVARLEKELTLCPYENCSKIADDDFFQQCQEELDYLFPSPPKPSTTFQIPESSTVRRGRGQETVDVIAATLLSGASCGIPFDPRMEIDELKRKIQKRMQIDATRKQKLFFGETELSAKTKSGEPATLGYHKVKAGSIIQVHVQLFEIPTGLQEAVFDLHWGYPFGSKRRDYLNASAFFYGHRRELAYSDYRGNHNELVYLEDAVSHSGGMMDNRTRTGRHQIKINFDNLPDEVDTIYFTLSSCYVPSMGLFSDPTLSFYDPRRPNEELCDHYVMSAPQSKGLVVCNVKKTKDGTWQAFGIGKPTAGSARNYRPIRRTLNKLAHGQL